MTTYHVTIRVDVDIYRVTVDARSAPHAVRLAVSPYMPCDGLATVRPLDGRPTQHVRYSTTPGRVARVSAYIVDPREIAHV